ncbi:MAG: caspase family protein [Nitrospiraceae bacterium]
MKFLQKPSIHTLAVMLWFVALSTAHGQVGKPEGLYYKSWGVVIGINDYLLAPKLDHAIDEAKAVGQALRQLGFEEVVELYDQDASRRRLQSILTDYLPRKVGRQDRVVIFFAGHAGVTKDSRGKELGYLVPWDAHVRNASKSLTLDDLKDFSRRVMSKHTIFLINATLSGWDVTPPQQLSLEGRLSPEEETEKRAVQLLTAGREGETVTKKDGQGVFVQVLLAGLAGAADQNKNGWLMASELGAYVKREVEARTGEAQRPQFVRLDGDGDMVLIEGEKGAFAAGQEPKTEAERMAAAKKEYDQAFSLLQQQRPAQQAIERLNKAVEYYPEYGDAYVLMSYVYLEFLSMPDEALYAGVLAVKYAPNNPDSHYTIGLVLQRMGEYEEAEKALRRAIAVNPTYTDVYLTLGDLYAQDLNDQEKSIEAYGKYVENGGTEHRVIEYLRRAKADRPPDTP